MREKIASYSLDEEHSQQLEDQDSEEAEAGGCGEGGGGGATLYAGAATTEECTLYDISFSVCGEIRPLWNRNSAVY